MRRTRSQHGVSTFMVIGLMGLVAMTLLAIGRHFTSQAQRTQRYAAEAQVRQLLLAGEAMARTSPPAEGFVPLPEALGDATLRLERDGEAFVITATLDRWAGRQRVTYRRAGDRLVVEDAVLEALP